jgi:CubicO group peptidase (beta-lactamase class C family)
MLDPSLMRLLIILFIGILSFACLTLPAHAFDSEVLDRAIMGYLNQFDPAPGSGLAIAVIENGQVVFEKGYGYRDRENKLPVTPKTVFAIGSNSKAFTSLALSMLRDEGRVNFDIPVQTYLPDFKLIDDTIASQVTLTDLLSHHVGLPRHDLMWYLTPFTEDELYEKLKFLPFNSDPKKSFRNSFQYNNLMYLVAGRLLSKLDGKPWKQAIQDRVLTPLHLSDTTLSIDGIETTPDRAVPYILAKRMEYKPIPSVAPAGAINSNLIDMEKWIQFYLRKGKDEQGRALVSPESLALMESPITDASSLVGIPLEYGLGWFMNPVDGTQVIWHGGNIDGFSTHVSFVPERNLGLIILTNQNNGGTFEYPFDIPARGTAPERHVLPWVIYHYLLTGIVQALDAKSAAARPVGAIPTYSITAPLTEYAGNFHDSAYGEITIIAEGDHLEADYYGHHSLLKPVGPDRFYFALVSDGDTAILPITFIRESGKITGLSAPMEPTSHDILFTR